MTEDTGYRTLEVIAKAEQFNEWMYKTVRPFCHGDILEIGSGIGNISKFFIRDGYSISLSDTEEVYQEELKKKFPTVAVHSIDLANESPGESVSRLHASFDTVFLLNVLEHVENEALAIRNCGRFLKQGGSLVLLVPAYSSLYSRMDKELGHFRRYSTGRLVLLVSSQGLATSRKFHFNALGILAWLYGKIFKLSSIPGKEMRLFNSFVPFAKLLDRLVARKAGLSLVLIAKKDL